MKENFFNRLLSLAKEAGDVACQLLGVSEPNLKKDRSVITKADQAISQLAKARLCDLLKTNEHILVDEEDPGHSAYLNQSFLNKVPYIWALDPIDGTRPYANNMPHFGISIGLIKDLKPWMGVVYFPILNELFMHDGEKAFFIRNAFSKDEKKQPILPVDETISSYSIFLCSDSFYEIFRWQSEDCHIIIPACAVVDLCWPAIGRGCGALLKSHLWDFAGSWPVFRAAGLQLRDYDTGEVFEEVSLKYFEVDRKQWKLKNYQILSSERNYSVLKKRLKKKS